MFKVVLNGCLTFFVSALLETYKTSGLKETEDYSGRILLAYTKKYSQTHIDTHTHTESCTPLAGSLPQDVTSSNLHSSLMPQ